jgi:putative redox protein
VEPGPLYLDSSYVFLVNCSMKAIVKQVEGCSFIGKSDSNHWVPIDSTKEYGADAATHPMELVLLALGSCTGCDVASILTKKKVQLQGFEIHIEAERSESYPKVFTSIHLEYIFYGKKLNTTHLRRAIDLSQEKYCPVSAMLKTSVPITTSYKIIEDHTG